VSERYEVRWSQKYDDPKDALVIDLDAHILIATFEGSDAIQNAQVFADMLNVRHHATKGHDD
jgi:hypothetical protein